MEVGLESKKRICELSFSCYTCLAVPTYLSGKEETSPTPTGTIGNESEAFFCQ